MSPCLVKVSCAMNSFTYLCARGISLRCRLFPHPLRRCRILAGVICTPLDVHAIKKCTESLRVQAKLLQELSVFGDVTYLLCLGVAQYHRTGQLWHPIVVGRVRRVRLLWLIHALMTDALGVRQK